MWIFSKGIFNPRQTGTWCPCLVLGRHPHSNHPTSSLLRSPAHCWNSKARSVCPHRYQQAMARVQYLPNTIDKEQETFCCIFLVSQWSVSSYHHRVSISLLQVPMRLYFILKSIPVNWLYQAFSLKPELQKAGGVSLLSNLYSNQNAITNRCFIGIH